LSVYDGWLQCLWIKLSRISRKKILATIRIIFLTDLQLYVKNRSIHKKSIIKIYEYPAVITCSCLDIHVCTKCSYTYSIIYYILPGTCILHSNDIMICYFRLSYVAWNKALESIMCIVIYYSVSTASNCRRRERAMGDYHFAAMRICLQFLNNNYNVLL